MARVADFKDLCGIEQTVSLTVLWASSSAFLWKAGSKGSAGYPRFNAFVHSSILPLPLSLKGSRGEGIIDLQFWFFLHILEELPLFPVFTGRKYPGFHHVDHQESAPPPPQASDLTSP